MMKKAFSVLLTLILFTPLLSCGSQPQPLPLSPEEYDALNEERVSPLIYGSILSASWQDANEIEADSFIYYYAAAALREDEAASERWPGGMIPADELEPVALSRFDVTTDHLRSSPDYDAERNAYAFGGLGSSVYSVVRDGWRDGDVTTVVYDVFGPMDYKIAEGTLTVEGDPMRFKYLSNRYEWSAQYTLAFPSAMEEVDFRGVFMMDSGGVSGEGAARYDGESLDSIIAFYQETALPALEATGAADTAKYEDGWFWAGTYRGGKPLAIDVQRRFGADSYVITAVHEGTAGNSDNAYAADNMREEFMQPPNLGDLDAFDGSVRPLFRAGLLDLGWEDAGGADLAGLVALYARSLADPGEETPAGSFPAGDVENYIGRYFDIDADTLRRAVAYGATSGMYTYAPADQAGAIRVVSVTSHGREESGAVRVAVGYEVTASEEGGGVLGRGEVTIELSAAGYRYLSHDSGGGPGDEDGGDEGGGEEESEEEEETEAAPGRKYYRNLSEDDEALYRILTEEDGLTEERIHALGNQGFTFEEMVEMPGMEIERLLAPGSYSPIERMGDAERGRLADQGLTEEEAEILSALGYDYKAASVLTPEQLDFIFPNTELVDHLVAAGYDRRMVESAAALTEIGGYETYRDLLDVIFQNAPQSAGRPEE